MSCVVVNIDFRVYSCHFLVLINCFS